MTNRQFKPKAHGPQSRKHDAGSYDYEVIVPSCKILLATQTALRAVMGP